MSFPIPLYPMIGRVFIDFSEITIRKRTERESGTVEIDMIHFCTDNTFVIENGNNGEREKRGE